MTMQFGIITIPKIIFVEVANDIMRFLRISFDNNSSKMNRRMVLGEDNSYFLILLSHGPPIFAS